MKLSLAVKTAILTTLLMGLLAARLQAQTVTSQLAFTHDGKNTTSYQLKIDAVQAVTVVPTPLAAVPGDLAVPLPPLAAGAHTLIISACNAQACAASAPLVVTIPVSPTNLRVVITMTVP